MASAQNGIPACYALMVIGLSDFVDIFDRILYNTLADVYKLCGIQGL